MYLPRYSHKEEKSPPETFNSEMDQVGSCWELWNLGRIRKNYKAQMVIEEATRGIWGVNLSVGQTLRKHIKVPYRDGKFRKRLAQSNGLDATENNR